MTVILELLEGTWESADKIPLIHCLWLCCHLCSSGSKTKEVRITATK